MLFFYLVSLFSGLLYGITESVNKNITEEKYSAFAYSFIQNFCNALIFAVPFFFFSRLPPLSYIYLYFIITIFITLVSNVLLIKAYKSEDVSSISIISRISLVISFFSGVLLLSDPFTAKKLFGLIVVLIGIVIIFYEKKKFTLSPGLLLALVSGISWGFLSYFSKLIYQVFEPITYLFINQMSLALIPLFLRQARRDAPKIFRKYSKKIIISRLTAVTAIYLYNWSIKRGNISVVTTNMETVYLMSTVLIGIIILKETKRLTNKFIGAGCCTLGIILLNFF